MKNLVLSALFVSLALLAVFGDRTPIHGGPKDVRARTVHEFVSYLDGVVDKTLPGSYVIDPSDLTTVRHRP